MTELRTKMRSTDSSANKAVTQKYKELDKRVNTLDAEFIEYQTKVAERQEKRQHVMDRLNNSITPRQKRVISGCSL
jgi:TolA-binding protein